MSPGRGLLALGICVWLCGCISSELPAPPRYFEPQWTVGDPLTAATKDVALEFSPLRTAEHLKQRMLWRKSPAELGFYDDERWTEAPVWYLERALKAELFERRGIQRARRSATYALYVDLIAFEEVLLPKHQARVAFTVSLFSPKQRSLLERTIEATQPVGKEQLEAMVEAMGKALTQAVREAGGAIQEALVGR